MTVISKMFPVWGAARKPSIYDKIADAEARYKLPRTGKAAKLKTLQSLRAESIRQELGRAG